MNIKPLVAGNTEKTSSFANPSSSDVLRPLSLRLLQLQDEERKRIARELSDGIGQLLAAAHIRQAQVATERAKLSPEAARCLDENSRILHQLMNEIRAMSYLLHPPILDEVGLQAALKWYVAGFSERTKVQVGLQVQEEMRRLPPDCEMALFRVVQECLTNIQRHSGSATAHIRLSRGRNEVCLEVADSGKGMSAETHWKILSGEIHGLGLRGIRERIKQFGGKLDIQSDKNGTTLRVVVPLDTEAGEASRADAAVRQDGKQMDGGPTQNAAARQRSA